MRFHPSRPVLAGLAVALAASLLVYTVAWMFALRPDPAPLVELGFQYDYQSAERAELVRSVQKQSPAEKAGLLPGDRVLAIEGIRLTDEAFETRVWMQHRPGDTIHLTIQRPGIDAPIFLTGVFRRRPSPTAGVIFGRQLNLWFPAPFVMVGLTVLFLRLEDSNAWLLALLFGGVAVSRGAPPPVHAPAWWPAAMAYQAVFVGMVGPLLRSADHAGRIQRSGTSRENRIRSGTVAPVPASRSMCRSRPTSRARRSSARARRAMCFRPSMSAFARFCPTKVSRDSA